jgi:hypothetical protein
MSRLFRSSFVAVALLWLASACVNTPRNGDEIGSARTPVQISGLASRPNVFLKYRMLKPTGGWQDLTNGTYSGTSPITDAAGWKWYSFSHEALISSNANLWSSAPAVQGQRRIMGKFGVFDSQDGYLTTFDADAAECGNNAKDRGLFAVLNECASANSPTAQVFRKCGKADQDCCLAHNISSSKACDAGRRCDTSNRCRIPSGGLNQVCNADNSCNSATLGCVAGTCRNTTIEYADLLTLDLEVRTCTDAAWARGARLSLDLGTGTKFQIHAPGTHGGPGQTDTYGLRVPGVERLSDINRFWLYADGARTCIDRIRLYGNGVKVFEKTFSPAELLDPTYPFSYDVMTISRDELRGYWTGINSDPICRVPAQIGGPQLERSIVGAIGHVLRDPGEKHTAFCAVEADCGGGNLECKGENPEAGILGQCHQRMVDLRFGTAEVKRYDSDEITVTATFTGRRPGGQFERSNVDMKLDMRFRAGCSSRVASGGGTDDEMYFTLKDKKLIVTRVDFTDPLAEFANTALGGLLEAFGTIFANLAVDDSAISFDESLTNMIRPVGRCPLVSFSETTPPAMELKLSSPYNQLNLCSLNALNP